MDSKSLRCGPAIKRLRRDTRKVLFNTKERDANVAWMSMPEILRIFLVPIISQTNQALYAKYFWVDWDERVRH